MVQLCKAAGYKKFRIKEHTDYWKQENARDPQKGFGTQVESTWYWYQNWVDKCIEYCRSQGDKYK